MWVCGNPGDKYDNTRHNVGFRAVDKLAKTLKMDVNKKKFDALIGESYYNSEKLILAKPQTYMNLSGESIKQIVDFYKISLEDMIVIYDDFDIPLGTIRIKPHGGTGTHNGMRNIQTMLGQTNFPRIRIGTGKEKEKEDLEVSLIDFVLMKLNEKESAVLSKVIENVSDAIFEILDSGIEKAMSRYNGKSEE